MLYAAEIFTPAGELLKTHSVGSAASTTPATPLRVLEQSLKSRLPKIFHLGTVQQKSSALSCVGLTLPIPAAGGLRSCVSLLWRVNADFAAALEVWQPDASGVLRLGDAYYGPYTPFQQTSAKTFESISRQMSFRVLEGLPGVTFDAHEPIIFETLSHTRGFVRSEAAAAAGFSAGLGIPVLEQKTASCAVLLLSSERAPLAQRFEVWKVAGRNVTLGSSRTLNPASNPAIENSASKSTASQPCADLATSVVKARLPQLARCEARLRVGIPIFRGREVGSVVVLEG